MPDSHPRALILEDETMVAAVIRRALLPDWDSDHFVEPDPALQAMKTQPYKLAFVDVKLQQHCGFEVVPRLQQQDPNLFIVVMSGYLDPETRERAERMKVFHFLNKPFKLAEIRGLVHRVETQLAAQAPRG